MTNLALHTGCFFIDKLKATLTLNNLFDETWVDPGIRTADGNYYAVEHPQVSMNGGVEFTYSF